MTDISHQCARVRGSCLLIPPPRPPSSPRSLSPPPRLPANLHGSRNPILSVFSIKNVRCISFSALIFFSFRSDLLLLQPYSHKNTKCLWNKILKMWCVYKYKMSKYFVKPSYAAVIAATFLGYVSTSVAYLETSFFAVLMTVSFCLFSSAFKPKFYMQKNCHLIQIRVCCVYSRASRKLNATLLRLTCMHVY